MENVKLPARIVSQVTLVVKNLPASSGDAGEAGSIPWSRKMATHASILA